MATLGRARWGWFRRRDSAGTAAAGTVGKWALLIFLALFPIGLLSLFAFRTATRAVRELVEASNLAAATIAADSIKEDLERNLSLSRSIAESPAFIEAVEERDEAEVRSHLRSVMEFYAPIDRAFVHDVDGVLWSDYPRSEVSLGRSFAGRDWYRGVSRNWEAYISEVYRRAATPRELVVSIAVPIQNQERDAIGILVTQYLLQQLREGLRYVRLGETGSIILLDPNGQIAAHPDLGPGARNNGNYKELEPVREALEGVSHTGEYRDPFSNVRKVATFLPLEITSRKWVIVAEQPVIDAYAPIRRIAWNIGGAGAILALAAIAVVMGMWRISDHSRKLNLKLERRNQALQKATAELERSNKELERSNMELEEFAYVASHDLQEPLRMVASYTQLLGRRYEGQLDETADKFIHYAVDGAKRMQALIQDLLKYSRVGTRSKPFQPTDFSKALNQALTYLKIAIQEEEAVVTCDPLPTLMADPTQITQVFQNLIGNAIKFRGKEPPRIHVSAERKEREWIFSVSDNGIGISQDYFDQIFVIFQRLPSEKRVSGTGLGLSVCKKIVERHGGRIWVESAEGKGSTFHFAIPENGHKLE